MRGVEWARRVVRMRGSEEPVGDPGILGSISGRRLARRAKKQQNKQTAFNDILTGEGGI